MIAGTIVLAGLLLLFLDEHSPVVGIFGNIAFYFLIPLLGVGVGVLQILVLIFGLKALVYKSRKGKALWILSIIYLSLNIFIHSIYFILFYEEFSWIAWGVIFTSSFSLANPIHLTGFILIIISTLGTVISFGYLLIIMKKIYPIEGLEPAGFAQLISILPYAIQYSIGFGITVISPVPIILVGGFFMTISFLILGIGLLKFKLEDY